MTARGPPDERGERLLRFFVRYPYINIPEKWRDAFEELMDSGRCSQREALEEILRGHGISATPRQREVFLGYSARGCRITKTIIEALVGEAYQRGDSVEGLTLAEVSDLLSEDVGIRLRERTLLILNKRYEARTGAPLLYEVPGTEPKRYLLHREDR